MAVHATTVQGEGEVVDSVRVDEAWALVEEFAKLVRESGTDEEREAVQRITPRLDELEHPVHAARAGAADQPAARGGADRRTGEYYPAKTPSMARSTGPERRDGADRLRADRLRAGRQRHLRRRDKGRGTSRASSSSPRASRCRARSPTSRSAAPRGVVFIAPGERIHEGICTSIWGSPDLTSWGRQPTIPVVSVSNPDGAPADRAARRGRRAGATLVAQHEQRWRPDPGPRRRDRGHDRARAIRARSTGTSTRGTSASATTRPATRRCSSWRACSASAATR